jgi:hypothetical protein
VWGLVLEELEVVVVVLILSKLEPSCPQSQWQKDLQ